MNDQYEADLGDEDNEAALGEQERLAHALYDHLQDFMEDEQLDDGVLSHLLVDAAINMRMVAYALSVEKPSVSGLKLDLDRFGQDIDHALRHIKKGAEEFIARAKAVRAAEDAGPGEDEDEGAGDRDEASKGADAKAAKKT
jgi:hypothetical protein